MIRSYRTIVSIIDCIVDGFKGMSTASKGTPTQHQRTETVSVALATIVLDGQQVDSKTIISRDIVAFAQCCFRIVSYIKRESSDHATSTLWRGRRQRAISLRSLKYNSGLRSSVNI
jgi:hypothetical protein